MKKFKVFLINLSKKNSLFRIVLRKCIYFKNKIIIFIYSFHKIDSKLVIFESYMGKSYSCSPKSLYLEMINNPKYSEYKFIWCFTDIDKYKNEFNDDRTVLVKYKSSAYFKSYSKAKYWFSNSRLPMITHKKYGQIYVQCWHGTPLKCIGNDILVEGSNALNTKKEIYEKYDNEIKKIDYFITPSRYATDRFITSFNMKKYHKENCILEVGYPRNDYLINYKNEDILRIKEKISIPKGKKVVLYAPTWRDNQHNSVTGYTYQVNIDFNNLMNSLGDDYIILFRAHYFVSNRIDISKYNGFVYDVSLYDDINDLFIISDYLITDYSSVLFDYANLRKPMIFYMYDKDYYENKLRGLYIDINELPGDVVTSEKEIIDIMKSGDAYIQNHINKYIEFNSKFNYLDDGNASKRVLDKVIE